MLISCLSLQRFYAQMYILATCLIMQTLRKTSSCNMTIFFFFVEFSLWKSLVRAIKPPIYRGPLVLYFPAQRMFLRFSLRDSLRVYHVSRRVVMSKSSRTVVSLCCHF